MQPLRPMRPGVLTAGVTVLCLLWGSTWLVIREGLKDLPPFSSAGIRFAIAALVMAALAPAIQRREGGGRPPLWLWLVSGATNFGISYGVVYWTEQSLPSGLTSLLWAVFPMMMAVSGHLFLPGEQLRPSQWIGFAFGLLGVAALFASDLRDIHEDAWRVGAIFMASPIVSVVGTTLVKKHGKDSSSALLNRNGMFVGAAILLAVATLTESEMPLRFTERAVFSIAYLSLMGTVTTFGLYFWLLRHAPAYKLSIISYVIPPIALFLGWVLADEPITRSTLLGAALIITGVILIVRRRAAEAEEPRGELRQEPGPDALSSEP